MWGQSLSGLGFHVVFCLWWYCVFFSIIIIWTKDQVGNFFRLQTKLRQAKFISIKSQIETEIIDPINEDEVCRSPYLVKLLSKQIVMTGLCVESKNKSRYGCLNRLGKASFRKHSQKC